MFLPAEWHKQEFVQLTWPHEETDWAPILSEAIDCLRNIACAISKYEPVLVVAHNKEAACEALRGIENVTIVEIPTNDTWARDHAFISCLDDKQRILLDFQFNGWGLKFASNFDNQINSNLFRSGLLKGVYENHLDFVLEGGSIESDGLGTLLTTSSCLLAPNRNSTMNEAQIEAKLKELFNLDRVLWLHHGYLAGDDTDGHVDTLARLCSPDTIAYVSCTDTEDEHYAELTAMEKELQAFRTKDNEPYRLIPLPLPHPVFEIEEGEEPFRLPATYANFLIINGAVLYPTYNQPDLDEVARLQLQKAFPDRDIVGIDCSVLIRQHGSLHCSAMQYPLK